jgi:hypothetical protein
MQQDIICAQLLLLGPAGFRSKVYCTNIQAKAARQKQYRFARSMCLMKLMCCLKKEDHIAMVEM